MHQKAGPFLLFPATLVSLLPLFVGGCALSDVDPKPFVTLETRTYVNAGLRNLVRVDLHINNANGHVFGTYSVVSGYSDQEADRVAYGFAGEISDESINVVFGGAVPYPVPPEREGAQSATWRFGFVGKGTEVVEIPTFGENYGDDAEPQTWAPYVMRLERTD